MNIEKTLKELIEKERYRYVHLIDGHALNTMLPQLTKERKPFVVNYVSLGGGFDITQGIRHERSRIQLLFADIVSFNGNAEVEADNVSAINETQKQHLNNIIDTLNASGHFEQIEQYDYTAIPLRFDAFCACLAVEFPLKETPGECIE